MTAAVVDHAPDTYLSPETTVAGVATRPRKGHPRLVPVPDCEPAPDPDFGREPHTAPTRVNRGAFRIHRGDSGSRTTAVGIAPPDPVGLTEPRRTPVRPDPARPAGVERTERRIPHGRPAAPASHGSALLAGPRPGTNRGPRPTLISGVARPQSPRMRVVSADSVPGWSQEKDMGVRMTSTLSLPPAHPVSATLARGLLEVLSGARPMEQLRTHCAPDVFAGLADTPLLGGRGPARLVTVMVCEPADGVAEVSAVFRCAGQVRAMALRLQGVDGRWRVTALQLG